MRSLLPEPRDGWRTFAGEVGVIVLGVLIALGVDQAAQSIGHSRDADKARATIKAELITNITRAKLRSNAGPCVDARLDELDALLDEFVADGRFQGLNWIGRPPRYGMEAQSWEAAVQSGRASHFEPDEQARYGSLYTALDYLYELQKDEQLVWSRLSALTGVDRLSADGLLTMRAVVGEARYFDSSINNVGSLVRSRAREVGLEPTTRIDRPATVCWPATTTPEQAQARLKAVD